ncbi:MAG: hypothetical protein VYD90_13225 [Pseudomonadota bacterium]|nr:hypothetical protein [Pseudomonadota bacterium]
MSTFDWPANLVPLNIDIRPPRETAGLTTSLSGKTQAELVPRPPFSVTMEFDELHGDEVLAWRAILGLLEGRSNTVRLPIFDLWYRASDAQIRGGVVPHSDGTFFSDGTGYATRDLSGVNVTGVQGQRNVTADFGDYGQLLQAGQYFGLGDYPYLATGVWWDGNVATIRTTPTLRDDFTDEALRLKPVMIGRLSDDDGGALMLKGLYNGAPSITFIEDEDDDA